MCDLNSVPGQVVMFTPSLLPCSILSVQYRYLIVPLQYLKKKSRKFEGFFLVFGGVNKMLVVLQISFIVFCGLLLTLSLKVMVHGTPRPTALARLFVLCDGDVRAGPPEAGKLLFSRWAGVNPLVGKDLRSE